MQHCGLPSAAIFNYSRKRLERKEIMPNDVYDGLNALDEAIQELPRLTLNFYSYGILMRQRRDDGSETEYAVSPAQLATVLSAKVRFESGLLSSSMVCVCAEGIKRIVVDYRAPQKTALFLDGSDHPVRVPLPGLLMIRLTAANDHPRYAIYAVKDRPQTLDTVLYHAPLPNVGRTDVCWGSVKKVSQASLSGSDLAEDWRQFLGSPFTNHSVSDKSKRYPDDIREQLLRLEACKARVYPARDLVKLDSKLSDILRKV
jgi:hypothetical protein